MNTPLQTPQEKVRQRRAQMLVHSYLYYWLDSPIVSDDSWQRWANELTELQKEYPKIGFYDDSFSDWDGSTGYHLPKDQWVIYKANQVYRHHQEMTNNV